MINKLERLAALGIELVPFPGMERYFVLARGPYATLVERRESQFGRIGATAMITDQGLAMLVWRGEQAYFVAKDHEQIATPEQVHCLRQFSSDLERALRAC
jgi:hypothetical protein